MSTGLRNSMRSTCTGEARRGGLACLDVGASARYPGGPTYLEEGRQVPEGWCAWMRDTVHIRDAFPGGPTHLEEGRPRPGKQVRRRLGQAERSVHWAAQD